MKKHPVSRLWWYLLLVILLSAFCFLTLQVWLTPYSVAYKETGIMIRKPSRNMYHGDPLGVPYSKA